MNLRPKTRSNNEQTVAITQTTQEYDPIQARTRTPRIYDARTTAGGNSTGTSRTNVSRIVRRRRRKKAEKAVESLLTKTTPVGRAYRVARRVARLARRKKKIEVQEQKAGKKKLTGIAFALIALLALIKDILDIFLHMTIMLSIFIVFIDMGITATMLFYYFFSGVKFTTKKLAVVAISALIEILPLISMLPSTVFSLFMIRALENNETAHKAAQKLSFGKGFA